MFLFEVMGWVECMLMCLLMCCWYDEVLVEIWCDILYDVELV